jgi:lactate dehydrogenase-like 2-hydroxyacid dehydrogenase
MEQIGRAPGPGRTPNGVPPVEPLLGRPRIAVTRAGLPGSAVGWLAGLTRVDVWPHDEAPTADQLHGFVAGAAGVLANGADRVDAALLAAAGPGLRSVSLSSMGYDAVDIDAVTAARVVATNTPDVLAETTADLAFAVILWSRRRLRAAAEHLHSGRWTSAAMGDLLGLDVHGARLGILGYGQIGQAVARRARGFGMTVQHHHPARTVSDELSTAVGFDELVSTSDVLSIHVPLNPSTRGLVGADVLARMKPTATLVNTGRGGVVDEAALLDALRAGRIHSAALDVMEREPRSDPADPLFLDERLVVLPHVGSATEATRAAMIDLAARNLVAVLSGAPALTPLPGTAARYE